MKNWYVAVLTALLMNPMAPKLHAALRYTLWNQVDEAINKGLPKTAITNLDLIIPAALKDKAYGEATKAIARKIVLEGNIQGNKPEEKITRMDAEIAKAPAEILPLLQTLRAHWYWHYFQQNRWRFLQRTATAQTPGKDFTTWDLPRLFAEIDKHFQEALSHAELLKKTPVAAFNDVLTKGTVPDTYRPTLYDFIAHEALKFYTSGEQAAAKSEDAFEISADSLIFSSAENFLTWNVGPASSRSSAEGASPKTGQAGSLSYSDSDSPMLKAILLYQELLRFHEKDKDPTAFIDADLARLVYGNNVAFGESKSARYQAALKAFTGKWADHEVSALALHYWARAVKDDGDWVEARRLAQRGESAHRNSPGGKLCHNLVQEIEAKSASITTERVWNCSRTGVSPAPKNAELSQRAVEVRDRQDACPTIAVHYRNVTQVYFRAVASDWNVFLEKNHSRPESLNDAERKELLAKAPTLEWSAQLPPTTDFKERLEVLPAPDKLKPGFYFIVASHDPRFGETENLVSYADVWVSELALVLRPREGRLEGFVLGANTGDPLTGAEIAAWYLDNNGNRIAEPKTATDTNGFFSFKLSQRRGYLLRARHNGQEIASQNEYWSYERNARIEPFNNVVFFTDRVLYRPGQTIQYKGIVLHVDQAKDNYEVLAGGRIKIALADPNGKEVATAEHPCNDYGSFSGSFTAPRDRLMGQYRLFVVSGEWGQTWLNVEEYKRPKFQVTLEVPKTAPKLNDKVSLPGKAEAYTGAAVDDAKVKWRVVREVRWPAWWGWYYWWRAPRTQGSQEIAHGTATTGTDGTFKVEFSAKPDPQVSEKDEASFTFAIYADVTDTTGETRSAQHGVNVGFTALQATLNANEWQTEDQPVELKIKTTTLDAEPQTAEGSVKVYRLKAPAQVQRPPLSGNQWRGGTDGEVKPAPDLSNPNNWDLADVIVEKGFTTDAEGKATMQFKLGTGAYRVMLETQDRFGKKVGARLPLQVLKPDDTTLAIKIPHLLAAPTWTIEPGEEFLALWGTGYEAGRAFIEVEHRYQLVERYWTKPDRTQQQIKRAVTEAMRGGFTLHVTQVRENRAFLESRRVDVPWSNKDLEVKWEHFTSKLQPNQKETWTAVISKSKARDEKVRAVAPHPGALPKGEGASSSDRLPNERSAKSPTSADHSPSPPAQRSGVGGEGRGEVGRSVERAVAEMVATLYDESLDQYLAPQWPRQFGIFHSDSSWKNASFGNSLESFRHLRGGWRNDMVTVELSYRAFPGDLIANFWGYGWIGGRNRNFAMRGRVGGADGETELQTLAPATPAAPAPMMAMDAAKAAPAEESEGAAAGRAPQRMTTIPGYRPPPAAPPVDLSQVTARKNLNETAFFFPQLTSDSNGAVRLTFTMPEALTTWRFLGFAHDRECRSGFLEDHAVTAKDLMVQPNPPRFLREGDTLEFTVKVSNQSAARQEGKVKLSFNSALDDQSADKDLNLQAVESRAGFQPAQPDTRGRPPGQAGSLSREFGRRQAGQAGSLSYSEIPFDIPSKESRSFSWRITVPDGCGFLTYKAVGSTGKVSDGEEGYLPVLSRRVFVTESLALPIRGPATKKFEFTKLLKSGKSSTLRQVALEVQMVSNPSWYAVMALPYLMEFPHECTEQTFNRLYANALARSVANSDPKIRRVFDQWKGTPALDSPLEKNQDLKSVMLEETPWVRQAQSESQARKNVGVLFDDNRLNSETERTLRTLEEQQLGDGAWPWFPGGRGNDYITLYITTGFGRLRHLGVDLDIKAAVRSLNRLDNWMDEHYREILKIEQRRENYVPSATDALYLYGRSFFLKDKPVARNHEEMLNFFLGQARKHWLKTACRQTQGHLAIALKRWGGDANLATARDIMRSLKERSVRNEEMGMFWRDLELSWWWYHAPIETQALMIEAFDEVMGDKPAVEDCRVWLLKQKQTQDWRTTKATADAVYALLLRGKDLLASDKRVEIKLDGMDLTPRSQGSGPQLETRNSKLETSIEPGTGFYEYRFAGSDIKPKLGEITVKKVDEGVAWGSVHWQYLEDMTKVTPYEGTPLKLKKTLYTKVNTQKGPVLEPVKGALQVGDELVVRIELRVDRDMEYIHLKDQRGSGTEPVNVLSRYKYQDGLAYYETTRDTASHFFIDYLPKGTYVFEYSTRIQLRGQYQTGLASIQCMYAPEFNSHSESLPLVVR